MDFEVVKSEPIYKGRVFRVRRDEVRMPGGRTATYDIVDHNGSVAIVPLDEAGNLVFVRQYRIAAQRNMLELPAGTLDAGEDPDVCAAREVREETGLAAQSIIRLGEYYLIPGYSTELMVVYLATGLSDDPLEGDEDEFLTVERIPVAEAYAMAERGEFLDCKTVAALLLARKHLLG